MGLSCQENKPSNHAVMGRFKLIPPGKLGNMWGLNVVEGFLKSCYSASHVLMVVVYRSQYCIAIVVDKVMSKPIRWFIKVQIMWRLRLLA